MSHNSPATPHTSYEPEYDEKNVYGEIKINGDATELPQFVDSQGLASSPRTRRLAGLHNLVEAVEPEPTRHSGARRRQFTTGPGRPA